MSSFCVLVEYPMRLVGATPRSVTMRMSASNATEVGGFGASETRHESPNVS